MHSDGEGIKGERAAINIGIKGEEGSEMRVQDGSLPTHPNPFPRCP